MLLAVRDRLLGVEAAQRVLDGVLDGMTTAAPDVVLASSSVEIDRASAAGHPTVLSLGEGEPAVRLESAIASAAAVLWITSADCTDVRSQLRLDSGPRRSTPIVSVVVSDEQPDLDSPRRERVFALWVPPEPTRGAPSATPPARTQVGLGGGCAPPARPARPRDPSLVGLAGRSGSAGRLADRTRG